MKVTIGVTGHRPASVGGYGPNAFNVLVSVFDEYLGQNGVSDIEAVITGMAIGWDQAVARTCINWGIPFIAAVPFIGQERKWPPHSQKQYNWLIERAQKVVVVSEGGYSPFKMQVRNRWIVDNSQEIVALWNKERSGGTFNCVKYALEKEVPVQNLYDRWLELK